MNYIKNHYNKIIIFLNMVVLGTAIFLAVAGDTNGALLGIIIYLASKEIDILKETKLNQNN